MAYYYFLAFRCQKKKKRELIVIHVHVDCKRVHLRVFKTNPDIYLEINFQMMQSLKLLK